jgi:hypothetical protein
MIGLAVHRTLEGHIAGLGLADVGSRGLDQGRQDKRGSPVGIQALVRACLSPCQSVGSRAAPAHNVNNLNRISGTVRYPPSIGSH